MTHTLVTFLGKGRDNQQTGYRPAEYRFPDGHIDRTAFFGLALARYLKPDHLVILGTSGSQWGVLVENFAAEGEEEDARLALLDAEPRCAIEQQLLDSVAGLLMRSIKIPVKPRLIPYGKDEAEQYGILQVISDCVPSGRVTFDLTHGFRHLGMVGFLSAFMLERVRRTEEDRINVDGLWYGALDMTEDGVTPVLRLDGLSAVQRWIDALVRFDAAGDYGVFADLLERDGVPRDKADCLRSAAFHERTFNLSSAASRLQTFLPSIDRRLPGASGLFQDELRKRLAWANASQLAEKQKQLACVYLDRRDFVRAAVFAWEAIITAECWRHKLDHNDFDEDGGRREAENALQARLRAEGEKWKNSAQHRIKDLRNALAHGSRPRLKSIEKAMADATRLYEQLSDDLKKALP